MTELQVGLLVIGVVVVAGVLVFNKWQERQYRRGADRSFGPGAEDVLMRGPSPDPDAPRERIEPALAPAAPTEPEIQEPDRQVEASQAEEPAAVEVPTPARTAPQPLPENAAILAEVLDFIAELESDESVSGAAVVEASAISLRRVFEELFQNRTLVDLRADRPKLIVVATELRAKAAFYFSADASGCWRYGTVDSSALTVAHAVTASAAYPAFLPALDETLNFSKGDIASSHRVCLTDGGVYDNLGLSPLWPDRKPEISLNVDRYDRIICCRAGYGLSIASPTHFWPSRMYASVDT